MHICIGVPISVSIVLVDGMWMMKMRYKTNSGYYDFINSIINYCPYCGEELGYRLSPKPLKLSVYA